ncbi:transmembrane protein 220-like [Mytilus trossulus]|uniref:transmembrane protein 220-like n=1 Tax=Mytilus trossulus TaxID=6551 RepID=UPI0030070DDC
MKGEYRITPPEEDVIKVQHGVKIWRAINAIMAVFFLLAALANLNDSDWYIWVPVYSVPGILSLVSCIKPDSQNSLVWSYVAVTSLGFCIALALYIIMVSADIKGINNPLKFEEGRELSGSLIIITWLSMSKFTNIGRPGSTVSNNVLRNVLLLIICLLAVVPVMIWSVCLHETGKGYHHCGGNTEIKHEL